MQRNSRIPWKLPLVLVLLVVAAAAMVLIPSVASAEEEEAPAQDHASHSARVEDDLAQVRRVTARFHDIDAAREAGKRLSGRSGRLA